MSGQSSGGSGGGGGVDPALQRGYLSSLNDQQIANIELQRQQWNQDRINSANPILSQITALKGEQPNLDALRATQKQQQALQFTRGGGGVDNSFDSAIMDWNKRMEDLQTQLNGVSSTGFTYNYNPTLTDSLVQGSDTYKSQLDEANASLQDLTAKQAERDAYLKRYNDVGSSMNRPNYAPQITNLQGQVESLTPQYQAQTEFENKERAKSDSLANNFGVSDASYQSLLDSFTLQQDKSKAEADKQNQNIINSGVSQSSAQKATGNAPIFSINNPRLQQAALAGALPISQIRGMTGTKTQPVQTNLVGGASGFRGQTNVINN